MNISNVYLEPAHYDADLEGIRYVRHTVFVVEQQIPHDSEFDELDRHCHHVLARDAQSRPIGTGRLSPEGRIGHIAVLPEWRRQGVGQSVLRTLIEKAHQLGLQTVTANAQLATLGFYEKFGFIREGDTFAEVGIPHQVVRLALTPLEPATRQSPKPRESSIEALRLDSLESTADATLQLITRARRQLFIYSRDLEYGLYGQTVIVEALKQFALRNRNAAAQIIVQDPEGLQSQTHPVLDLAQRLPSYFLIRTPIETEDLQYLSAFLLSDDQGYLFRLLGDRYEGHWSPNLPARNRPLREAFERVWQRSRPCSEFRALGI